ncbi:MAG: hypothetical protein AMXMBFR7_47920 [Planctomycetota bacterium]
MIPRGLSAQEVIFLASSAVLLQACGMAILGIVVHLLKDVWRPGVGPDRMDLFLYKCTPVWFHPMLERSENRSDAAFQLVIASVGATLMLGLLI